MLLLTPWSAIASSCCRWTPTGACGTNTTRDCTGLHEFLEGKTATHDFESLSCIGSNYAASFDGAVGNVSLTSSGAAVAAVPTPLKVTHASDCSATLHLQLDTVVLGNLTVGGLDVAAELAALGATPSYITCPACANATYWLFPAFTSSISQGVLSLDACAAACTADAACDAYLIEESGVCQLFRGLSGNTYYSCSYGATGTWYGGVNISVATNNTNRCDQSGRRLEQASAPEGRRLAVFPGDGPLSTNGRCGYVSNEGQERCSALHEYLESKTTTRVFDDIDACLGTDQSAWAWRHDGATSDVTISGASSSVIKTPLKVTHAADCTTTPPTLTLQLDTVAERSLIVGGYDPGHAEPAAGR